jgi:hypothetical protein
MKYGARFSHLRISNACPHELLARIATRHKWIGNSYSTGMGDSNTCYACYQSFGIEGKAVNGHAIMTI